MYTYKSVTWCNEWIIRSLSQISLEFFFIFKYLYTQYLNTIENVSFFTIKMLLIQVSYGYGRQTYSGKIWKRGQGKEQRNMVILIRNVLYSQVWLVHILLTNFFSCFTRYEPVLAKRVDDNTGVDKARSRNLVVANQVFSGKSRNKVINNKSWSSWCIEKKLFSISDGNMFHNNTKR